MIVMVDQVKLDYWKERLCDAEYRQMEITMIPPMLRWFVETIEYLQRVKGK
jgi:hypothetical protein